MVKSRDFEHWTELYQKAQFEDDGTKLYLQVEAPQLPSGNVHTNCGMPLLHASQLMFVNAMS